MFKLLTEEEKEKVLREYNFRRGVVILTALIVVIIIGMAGLFPSYVLSRVRQKEVEERVKIAGNTELQEDSSGLRFWLKETNLKLKILDPALDQDRPSDFIESVLAEKSAGVKIVSLEWTKVDGKITLSISGIAQDRQTLLSFENELNSSGKFVEATLPVSNLAKEKDISFRVKLTPKTP